MSQNGVAQQSSGPGSSTGETADTGVPSMVDATSIEGQSSVKGSSSITSAVEKRNEQTSNQVPAATVSRKRDDLRLLPAPAMPGKETLAPRPTTQPQVSLGPPVALGFHPLAAAPFQPSTFGFLSAPAVLPANLPLPGLPATAPSKPDPTASIFHNRKLRSGKWIPEEEKYAELLVSLFEKGQLPNCEHGSTLRSYLSQQLHCAPMRISKKFAGKGIGKLVYLSKRDAGISVPASEQHRIEKEVKDLEKKFYDAVFPGNDFLASFESANSGSTAPVGILPGLIPAPALPVSAASGAYGHHVNGPHVNGPLPTPPVLPTPQVATAQGNGKTDAFASHAKQLQMSYMNALSKKLSSTRTQAPSSQMSTKASRGNAGAPLNPQMQSVATIAPRPAQTSIQSWTQQVVATPVAAPSRDSSMMPPAKREPSSGDKSQLSSQVAASGSVQVSTSDVPDFLAGFDKVAGGPKATVPVDPSVQYSPPFTSRSFDDFHRLLGKDISQLGEAATTGASPGESKSDENSSVREAMAQFTAESYAFFAQESCIAASQHDAYLSQESTIVAPSFATSESFDFEGTVDMVSEDVNRQWSQRNSRTTKITGVQTGASEEGQSTSGSEGLTPVERFRGSQPLHHLVSGSDTGGSANDESANESARTSHPSSTSGSNTSDDNKSDEGNSGVSDEGNSGASDEGNSGVSVSSANDSDGSSDEGPKRKKMKSSTQRRDEHFEGMSTLTKCTKQTS